MVNSKDNYIRNCAQQLWWVQQVSREKKEDFADTSLFIACLRKAGTQYPGKQSSAMTKQTRRNDEIKKESMVERRRAKGRVSLLPLDEKSR